MITLYLYPAIGNDVLNLPTHLKLYLLKIIVCAFPDFINVAEHHQPHLFFTFLLLLETSIEIDTLMAKFVNF